MGRSRTAPGLQALLLLLCGCGPARESRPAALLGGATPPSSPVARPASCREVAPGAPLQAALDAAPDGAVLCLQPGRHAGPVTVDRGQALFGPREAVIASGGQGTTVRLRGKGAQLLGLTVSGSGGRFDKLDAAVQVEGEDLRVEGVRIEHATFGILVDRSRRALVQGNEIHGTDEAALGLRGDGIRFWETTDSAMLGNWVSHSRDLVIRYSHRNRLEGNTITGGRYGMHLMYSHDNALVRNRSVGNVVGLFIMYSRNAEVRGNLLGASGGAAGIGLGVKESGNLRVEGNVLVANTTGSYLDTTPLYVDDQNVFRGNAIRLSDVGVIFHSSQRRNRFLDNSLRDNEVQVRVEGGGDALEVEWSGNDWDDYAGFDFDGDGFGDVPYALQSLSSQLTSRFPDLAFLRGAPALALVDAVSHILPLYQPRPVLVDRRPRMAHLDVEALRAR